MASEATKRVLHGCFAQVNSRNPMCHGTGPERFCTLPTMSQSEHVDHLAQIDLFSGCSKKELREIARNAEETSVKAGTEIVAQGEVGRAAYVILEGKATVRRGRRKVAELNEGAPIGELSLLDKGPRTAYVVADTDMRLLKLDANGFRAALDASPALSYKLLGTLATRVRELDRAIFG